MKKILLIEDDSTLALGIQYSLQEVGMKIYEAKNLKNAYKTFKEKDLDLILLDITLPDGNGYEFCKKVRKESLIPIIFLTACDNEANIVLGLDLGGDDYITKPFGVKELISRINATIRRSEMINKKAFTNNLISFGNITINLEKGKVTKNNEEVTLTPIEYKLLKILALNKNGVLSRNQILSKIWDNFEEFIDNNTLSVHIRRLREKIEDNPAIPKYIITVRGVGYKLSDKN